MKRDPETLAERYAECLDKRRFIIEALRDEQVGYEAFCRLVNLATDELIELKRERLMKARERGSRIG